MTRAIIELYMRRLLLSVIFAGGCTAHGQQPATSADSALVLDGLTIIEMTPGSPPSRGPMSILIRGERIAELYSTGSRPPPAGARSLDLRGRYAIPGLVDAHVHLTAPFSRTGQQDSLSQFLLLGGITAVRDMAGDGVVLQQRARAARSGATLSPRIFYSTLIGSHGHFTTDRRVPSIARGGTPGQLAWMRGIAVDGDGRIAAVGAREIGATGLKAYAGLTAPLLAAAVREAHGRGLKVWSHASVGPATPSEAVTARVDVLSHASYLVGELADSLPGDYNRLIDRLTYGRPADSPRLRRLFAEMRRRGTMLDPTLNNARRLGASRAVLEGELQHMVGVDAWSLDAARLAHRAGVRFVAGTDVSGYPGRDALPLLHDELAIYVEDVGLTPLEALTTATRHGAEMLGAERDFGTIARGRFADLVILDADPLANIRNTRRIAYVVKGGVVHAAPPR